MSGSIAVLLAFTLFGSAGFVLRAEALDCHGATPSQLQLWPPNHKLVPITIRGVVNNGNPVVIVITGITQDEPLDHDDDGDTTPDAFGVGTSTAHLRAERQGNGNGRVYEITFRATSGLESCVGSVTVCVPKSQGKKWSDCSDDGQQHDSTEPATPPGRFRIPSGPLRSRPAPNPFNPTTRIEYTLPTAAVVSLAFYDATGRQVHSMMLGQQPEGTHFAAWDGRDDANGVLPSGLYIYRIVAGPLEESGRLVIVR